MGFRMIRLENGKALLAVLIAGLLLPAVAEAMPMQATEDPDLTDCFDQTPVTVETQQVHDAVGGNYWARRDTFTLNGSCLEETFFQETIHGLSIIVKTPFQIDSIPNVDDIDTLQNFQDIIGDGGAVGMEDFWPDFDHWGANAFLEAGGAGPTIQEEGAFESVEICVDAASVASCLAGSPVMLTDIGGGFMIHTIDLDELEFEICTGDCSEEKTSFEIVTLARSNITTAPGGGDILPELVLGFRLVELKFVPEPAVLALLGPVLAGLALRRRARHAPTR